MKQKKCEQRGYELFDISSKTPVFCRRCIDIQQSNEVERTQALRLVRKMITVNASLFPSSVANSLIAVGNDGLQERDRMVRACIAIICELALQNPEVVALRGGLNTILKNVIDCQLSRINEALITTILHLLNHPKTRQYVRADVELERRQRSKISSQQNGNHSNIPVMGRPDLMDNYLALILSAFIRNGLLEGLVEVITNSDDHISVRATILLGELLHMANTILPHSHSHHLHCLPTLMNMAASFDIPKEKRLRASAALNCLKRFHEMKKRGPKPYSLHLDHIIQKAIATHQKRDQYLRVQKDIFILKDTEEALLMNLRDSQVLQHKENLEWNWNLIGTILKWPNVNLRNYKDEQLHRFVRRLLYFYKPSSKLYANLDLDFSKSKQLTVVGCQFTEFLLESEEACRLYATKHLRVLLRANVEFFNNWGIELLVTQLHDKNKTISSEALDILDEACEDKANLHALIQMKPALSHLGDKGLLLLLRFLSIPKGFSYLNERGYVAKQLEKWHKEYNSKYVDLIEEQLNEALTTYRKPIDGDNYVRRSNQRTCVYVLGLIAKTKQGCDILKCHNWDAVRHSRKHLWPVVPDDIEQLCNELSSIPSTLSLNSESTSSRHNSESESAPSSMFIMEDDRFGSSSTSTFFLDINEDAEPAFYDRPGPIKDKNSFPFFASSKLVKNLQKTLQLETSFVGNKHIEDTGSTPSIGENDLKFTKSLGSSHTLPRRAQSLKAPSIATIKSLADCNFSYTSSRDAFGYATLKRLQQQRMHPSLSHSEALASPAKDVLFTDTITMKANSFESRLTPSSDGVSQEGSASSTKSTELLLGVKTIPDDTPMCRILLRKEVLRLVINLSSSVSTKCHETGLLTCMKKQRLSWQHHQSNL
ncbi:hypothetical protein CB1_000775024 [Camelus ferus]|nr:hypothetical protein CB1_000775024 [Camelus ferus]